jgi:hypothetical protein
VGKYNEKSSDQDFYEKNINLVYNGKIDMTMPTKTLTIQQFKMIEMLLS